MMFGRVSREVAIYLRAFNKMGPGLRSAANDLQGLEKAGTQVFKRIAQAGVAAMAAIAAASIAVGQAFEQGLANTSSMFITAAKDAQELSIWTAQLSEKARELGKTTAFSAREATDAMYALASGGLEVGQVIDTTNAVLELAGATLTDMTFAAELTMSAMLQFDLKAKQSARVVNVFAAGIQNSTLNMERLGSAMVFAGPMSAALNLKLEETIAVLGLLHNANLKGSLAGTGLRMMFTKLIAPGKALSDVLGGLTVETDGFGAVIQKLQKANLGPGQLSEMFGPRAFSAVRALVKAGREGFDEMTKAVTGTNAAADMYAHQMNTIQSQTKILKSAMEETGIAIFEAIQPTLMDIVKAAQDFVDKTRPMLVGFFQDVVDKAKAAWPTLKSLFSDLKDSALALWQGTEPLRNGLAATFEMVANNTDTFIALTKAIVGTTAVIFLMVKAWRVLTIVMSTNPWVAAAVAIGVAIGFIIEKLGGWKMFLLQMELGIRDFGIALKAGIGFWVVQFKSVGDIFMWLISIVVDTFTTIGSVVASSVKTIVSLFKKMGEGLLNPFSAGDIFGEIKTIMSTGLDDLGQIVMDGFKNIVNPEIAENHTRRMAELQASYDSDLENLKTWYLGKLAEFNKEIPEKLLVGPRLPGGQFFREDALIGPRLPLGQFETEGAMFGPMPAPPGFLSDPIQDEADATLNIMEALSSGMNQTFTSSWDAIIDTHRSGSEKWKDIWKQSSKFVWGLIGKTVLASVTGDKAILSSSLATNLKEQAANMKTAATGFFKAYAAMPFIGQALAVAAIIGMTAVISSMHTGGMIGGGGSSGSHQEQLFMGQRGEFVMPPDQTAANLSMLEAMRSGRVPALSAAGAGGSSGLNIGGVTVIIPEGSLVIANDDMSVRRLATAINDQIEERISKSYRG